jgi:hypothetical protein
MPELVKLIKRNAVYLKFPQVFVVDDTLEPVDPQVFLGAFSLNESSGGKNNKPKHEAAYDIGGRYCKGRQFELVEQYGSAAACSYSSFQLMFICFYEMGFSPTPSQAGNDEYAITAVVKFFNRRIFKDGTANDVNFIGLAGDAYNSGNWHDGNVPADYIKKLIKNYHLAFTSELFDITIDPTAPKPWQGNIK